MSHLYLTIHRGSNEVGGNCVELATENSRIVLDVGMPLFDDNREPFDKNSVRGKSKAELLADGILPNVSGLFDSNTPSPDAILLSHAHEDHTGLLRFSNETIPVFASKGTSKMMHAGSLFAAQTWLPRDRHQEIMAGVPFQVGDFRVTPYAVDHSIYGSLAFLIEAATKTVFYSGDLRLHGRKPGMAKTLLADLANRTVDVLLMEGTHFGLAQEPGVSEYELEEQLTNHIAAAPGLMLVSFSPQHVDRLVGFIRAAIKTKRVFVVDVYTAYVMYLIHREVPVPLPTTENGFRVYFPSRFDEMYERKGLHDIRNRFIDDRIELHSVRDNPNQFLMLFRESMAEADFGNEFPDDTRCIYSRWEGYLEQPGWQDARSAIEKTNGKLIIAHTSGHIFANDIVRFVKQVNPKTVVPIHTFDPGEFQLHFDNVRMLDDGRSEIID